MGQEVAVLWREGRTFLPTIERSAATKDGEKVVDVPVECAGRACRSSMPADNLLEEVARQWRVKHVN